MSPDAAFGGLGLWLLLFAVFLAGASATGFEPPTAADSRPAAPQPGPTAPGRGNEGSIADPAGSPSGLEAEATALKRETVAIASQVAEAYPEDALSYALLGSAYFNTGRTAEATRYLRKCLELNPRLADAYDILARVAYDKGDPEEAVRLCRQALELGPANGEVLNRLGRALTDLGRSDEAIRVLQQSVALPRPASESYYLLGQAQLQSGKYADARESFLRVVGLVPDHTQAYFGLFTACTRLGQADEAARYREQFLKLEGIDRRSLSDRSAQEDMLTGLPLVRQTIARTLFGASQIYRSHEQPEKAVELLRRAASLDAESPLYRAALESYYVQRNAIPEGVGVFEKLARDQPASGPNYLFLGRLQGRLQQIDAAETSFRKVQELTPDWPEGYRALADLYLRTDRKPAEARSMARKLVELAPTAPNHYLLAVACVRNDDRAGALQAVRQALALSPGEKRYQELLQQLQASPK